MSAQIFPVRFGINRCYLIKDEGSILIDAGPPNKLSEFKKFINGISILPEDVCLIVLTHGDFDHVGSAVDIKSYTGAKIAIHRNDRKNFEEARHNFPAGANAWGRFLRFILNPFTKMIFSFRGEKADILLNESDFLLTEFGINGKIVYTPGHTPGSVSVILDSGEAFIGCMAHNNLPFRLKPGLPIFAENIDTVRESWLKLLQRGVKTIYPAHGDPFPVTVIQNILNVS